MHKAGSLCGEGGPEGTFKAAGQCCVADNVIVDVLT